MMNLFKKFLTFPITILSFQIFQGFSMEDPNESSQLKEKNLKQNIQGDSQISEIIESNLTNELAIVKNKESFWSPYIPDMSQTIVKIGFFCVSNAALSCLPFLGGSLGVYGINPLLSYEIYGNETVQSYIPHFQKKVGFFLEQALERAFQRLDSFKNEILVFAAQKTFPKFPEGSPQFLEGSLQKPKVQ
jgi:hypothetical protein